METANQTKMAGGPGALARLAAGLAICLCLLAVPAQGMLVILDLGWGYNADFDMTEADLISGFNLQEGSIVQVIMYDSATASAPGTNAWNNFDPIGSYSGTNYAAPYTNGAEHIPTEQNVYNPYSVPSNHVLAYTTQIGPPVGGNANGYDWYNVYAQFRIFGSYDSLYIRVFGATNFSSGGTVFASYWGISEVNDDGPVIGTWLVTMDDTVADHKNYFEVIPEPGSLALIVLGVSGLWAGRQRRSRRA